MLNRSSDVELDFDFDNVIEKSKDNPLYYVQYCYARIASVFRHLEKDLKSDIKMNEYNFQYSNDEIKILKKISEWPKCIDIATNRLEPHRIPTYLYELASLFHSYWNLGKENPEKRFINENKKITDDKLIFLKVISNVIKSGMDIVGVSTPEKMMIKELRNFIFLFIIIIFIFFTTKYYFSDHIKKSYRSLSNINKDIEIYSKKLPTLENDTNNIIEYVKNTQSKKKKKYNFWKLLEKDE